MYQFAIIGCGRIAQRHAEQIARTGRLRAVCDILPERAAAMAAIYDATPYSSIDALLAQEKEVGIISVCTPNGWHAEHVIKSLQAGRHVLCEKPLCLTSAAAWQIIETEKYTGRRLFVVKSNRYNPVLQQLQSLLRSGQLGKVYSFHLSCLWNRPPAYYGDWHGTLFPDGGTLYTQFSHYIDAMISLFGMVREVKGYATNAAHEGAIEFEDTGVAALQMENGSLGSFHWSVNAFRANHEIALTVLASKGTVRISGPYLNEVQYYAAEAPSPFTSGGNGSNDYGSYSGSMSNHRQVYDHLLRALDGADESFANAFDGLHTVTTIEKIYKAVSPTRGS